MHLFSSIQLFISVILLTGKPANPAAAPVDVGEAFLRSLSIGTGVQDIDIDLTIRTETPALGANEVRLQDGSTADIREVLRRQLAAVEGKDSAEAERIRERLKPFESGDLEISATGPVELLRQRWRIARDGAFRIDQTKTTPEREQELQGAWHETYLTPGERTEWKCRLEHGRRIAWVSQGRWLLYDWRLLGTPAFVGKTRDLLVLSSGGLPGGDKKAKDEPTEFTPEMVQRFTRPHSVERGLMKADGRVVDLISFGLPDGPRTVEFVVDAGNPRICYEINLFDANSGYPVQLIHCDRFEPVGDTDIVFPRRAEIVAYRDGQEVKREQITVSRVEVNKGLSRSLFDLDAVVPAGWTVTDSRTSPPSTYPKQ
jgi:hypothetical protein